MLVGRDRQRAAIDQAIAQGRCGRAAALSFSGPPGIGKTALLAYAVQRAEGMMLLRARGIESEAQIPFASLLELLRPALPLLGHLAGPQAAALEQAFALRPGRTQDRFAVAAATLGLVAACAEQQPVLVVLDDIQWFDGPSSEALRFALRRLDADPVVAILAVRELIAHCSTGPRSRPSHLTGRAPPSAPAPRRSAGGGHERLVDATGGNPLALLELAADQERVGVAPEGAPILVSTSVGRLPAPQPPRSTPTLANACCSRLQVTVVICSC